MFKQCGRWTKSGQFAAVLATPFMIAACGQIGDIDQQTVPSAYAEAEMHQEGPSLITGDVRTPRDEVRPKLKLQPPRPLDFSTSNRGGRQVVDGVVLPVGPRLHLKATGRYEKESGGFTTLFSLRLRF